MDSVLRQIDNRITQKRIEFIKRDLVKMSEEAENQICYLKDIGNTYKKVLDKDKPVGKSLNAVRYLKNVR